MPELPEVEAVCRKLRREAIGAMVRTAGIGRRRITQRKVAGLGNIYAAEALFAARIDPRPPIGNISRRKIVALHDAIIAILGDAVQSACIAYSRPEGFQEAEEYDPAVYDREGQPCRECGRTIRRIVQRRPLYLVLPSGTAMIQA